MKRYRSAAVAIALVSAAVAAAGCGFGAGEGAGEVSLTVTRDYGAELLAPPVEVGAVESDTVMRLLEGEVEITTRYGGGYVQSIGGVSEAVRDGRRYDWFFYVNGVESPIGAADFELEGGESIWWDYREWAAASRVPAVVGSWPRPLLGGYEGERRPVAVECRGGGDACGEVRARLRAVGVEPAAGAAGEAIRVLVGPWERLREDPAAAQLERGPQTSGVFAEFERRGGGYALSGLDEAGAPARAFGPDAGLVAATRRYEAPPVWLVTGATASGVAAAATLLDAESLRDHYAVATEAGEEASLPIR